MSVEKSVKKRRSAIKILSFQNFYKVLKTCSAGRKDFFDTLAGVPGGNACFLCSPPYKVQVRGHTT